jgi:hypothetical protein
MNVSWLADKIEQWPTARLLPYARRRAWGRLAAAQKLGLEVVPDYLTPTQCRAGGSPEH